MCSKQRASGCNMTSVHWPYNNYSHGKVWSLTIQYNNNTHYAYYIHSNSAGSHSSKCQIIVAYCGVISSNDGQKHWAKWSLLICNWIFFCLCIWNVVSVLTTVKSCYAYWLYHFIVKPTLFYGQRFASWLWRKELKPMWMNYENCDDHDKRCP